MVLYGGTVQIISMLDGYAVADHFRIFPGSRGVSGDKPIAEEPEHPSVSEVYRSSAIGTKPSFVIPEKGVGFADGCDSDPVFCGVQWLTRADQCKK
jgi:hypothetical protein